MTTPNAISSTTTVTVPPTIPADMSTDGREVWDWADRMSRFTQDNARRSRILHDVARRTCGDCSRWMTRACVRERSGGLTGRSTGPSSEAHPCSEYAEKGSTTTRRESLRAELAILELGMAERAA
jgi:hypothetical protein